MDNQSAVRSMIIQEAKSWLGTPYHNLGDVKGVGVDCAMLLVRVYCDLQLVPLFDPRPYHPEWYLHRNEQLYLAGMERYSHRVESALPADIAVFRFGRSPSHGAIILDDQYMLHAHKPSGSVVIHERSTFADRLHGYWSIF